MSGSEKYLCEICHNQPAETVFYTQINGKKVELYVCKACAELEHAFLPHEVNVAILPQGDILPPPGMDMQAMKSMPLSELEKLSSFLDKFVHNASTDLNIGNEAPFNPLEILGKNQPNNIENEGPKCPNCGMSFSQSRSMSLLDCAKCYETFASFYVPVIRDLQKTIKKPCGFGLEDHADFRDWLDALNEIDQKRMKKEPCDENLYRAIQRAVRIYTAETMEKVTFDE